MPSKKQNKDMSKFKWRKSYWWFAALVIVTLFGLWVSTLNQGTKQYPEETAYIYTYSGTQSPVKPVAGKPVKFTLTIKENGRPLASHKVKVGIAHRYGFFAEPRSEDTFEKEIVTSSDGSVSFSHTFKFYSMFKDDGFGLFVTPVLSEAEQAQLHRDEIAGKHKIGTTIAPGFSIPAVYPHWLSWLIWW